MANAIKVQVEINAKDKASDVINKMGDRFVSFGKTVAKSGAVAAGAITGIGAAVYKLAGDASRGLDLSRYYFQTFGDEASGSLQVLRDAAKGTIDDVSLMESANRASLLGVSSSVEELSGVMLTARLRGKAMGLSTEQAFSDLVTGIGRGSPLILDNLGIKIPDAFKAMVEDMTGAAKTTALMNMVIKDGAQLAKEMGGDVLTASDKFEIMKAKVKNLKQSIGEGLIPVAVGFIDSLQTIGDNVNKDHIGRLQTSFAGLKDELGVTDDTAKNLKETLINFGTKTINVVIKKAGDATDALTRWYDEFDVGNYKLGDSERSFESWASKLGLLFLVAKTGWEEFINDFGSGMEESERGLTDNRSIFEEWGNNFGFMLKRMDSQFHTSVKDFKKGFDIQNYNYDENSTRAEKWGFTTGANFRAMGIRAKEMARLTVEAFNDIGESIRLLPTAFAVLDRELVKQTNKMSKWLNDKWINPYNSLMKQMAKLPIVGKGFEQDIIAPLRTDRGIYTPPSGARMAEGGIVKSGSGGVHAVIGEGNDDEVVMPLNKANNLGGVSVNIYGDVYGVEDLADKVKDGLQRASKLRGVTPTELLNTNYG